MDRAGLTPAYPVEVRHRGDQHALEATEFQDPEVMARQILEALPQVVAMLPPTESGPRCSGWRGWCRVEVLEASCTFCIG